MPKIDTSAPGYSGPFRCWPNVETRPRAGLALQVTTVWSGGVRGQQLIALDEDEGDKGAHLRFGDMRCRWLARTGERPVSACSWTTGPSSGIEYGVGVRPQKRNEPSQRQ